jgi:hypothetical protein
LSMENGTVGDCCSIETEETSVVRPLNGRDRERKRYR